MENASPNLARLTRVAKSLPSALRRAVCLFSALLILANAAALVILFTFENEAAAFFSGGDPEHFYAELQIGLLDDYQGVLGIAHNSGNVIQTTLEALAYDADIIEIDVVFIQDRLHAAHWSPFRFIGDRFFHGPTLAEVWGAAAQAEVIKLDLKDASNEMVDTLLAFLANRRRANKEVIVVSDKSEILALLPQAESRMTRLLSVSKDSVLRDLLGDRELLRAIDGVSVRHDLLAEDSATSLKEEGLIVLAWTVNEPERVNELVEWGVDGITTDNLAILQLLGAQQREVITVRGRIRQ
jgi:glycerophosphoryl diester phosphodiesterase